MSSSRTNSSSQCGSSDSGARQHGPREKRSLPLLLKLSEACITHREFHTAQATSEKEEDNSKETPDQCRKDLKVLRSILPKVEAEYQVPSERTTIRKRCTKSDVSNLCRFYQTTVLGGFCPHAKQLFDNGTGAKEILPRVHQLLRHLISNIVVEEQLNLDISSNKTKNNATPAIETTSSPEKDSPETMQLSDQICITVTNLLNIVPEQRVQQCILRDLMAIVTDLSVLSESGILPTDDSGIDLVIFIETVAFQRTSLGTNDREYLLTVTNDKILWALQNGVLQIIRELQRMMKEKRSDELPNEMIPPQSSATEQVDFRPHTFSVETGEVSLLGALRQVMTSQWPPLSNDGQALNISCRISAAKILQAYLVEEYERTSSPLFLDKMANIVSHAILCFFQGGISTAQRWLSYGVILSQLLCELVIFPPLPSTCDPKFLQSIRDTAILPLLSCIPFMKPKSTNHNAQTRSKPDNGLHLPSILLDTVLHAIHSALCSGDGVMNLMNTKKVAYRHCADNGIFPSLMKLMNNEEVSSIAICITATLRDCHNGDIHWACLSSLTLKEETSNTNEDASSPGTRSSKALSPGSSATKRRRLTYSISPRARKRPTRTGPQLQIEHGPRQKPASENADEIVSNVQEENFGTENCLPSDDAQVDEKPSASSTHQDRVSSLDVSFEYALRHALKLANTIDKSTDVLPPSQDCVESILICLRLLSEVLYSHFHRSGAHHPSSLCTNATVEVWECLCRATQTICSIFCRAKHESGHNKPSFDVLINAGLHLSQARDRLFFRFNKGFQKPATESSTHVSSCDAIFSSLERTLDSLAALSLVKVSEAFKEAKKCAEPNVMEERTQPNDGIQGSSAAGQEEDFVASPDRNQRLYNRSCVGFCSELKALFASDEQVEAGRDKLDASGSMVGHCCCGLLRERECRSSGLSNETSRSLFRSDVVRLLLERFPLNQRCLLLSCLHPVVDKDLGSISLIRGILASGVHRSPQSLPLTTASQASLPYLIIALAARKIRRERRSPEATTRKTTCYLSSDEIMEQLSSVSPFQMLQEQDKRASQPCPALLHFLFSLHLSSSNLLKLLAGISSRGQLVTGWCDRWFSSGSITLLLDLFHFTTEMVVTSVIHSRSVMQHILSNELERTSMSSPLFAPVEARFAFAAPVPLRKAKWDHLAITCSLATDDDLRLTRTFDVLLSPQATDNEQQETDKWPALLWLLRTPFLDGAFSLRTYSARLIGPLAFRENVSFLPALTLNDSEWRMWSETRKDVVGEVSATFEMGLVADRLFRAIDAIVPQSSQGAQPSTSSGGTLPSGLSKPTVNDNDSVQGRSCSAVYALSSLCRYAGSRGGDNYVFEGCCRRLVRFWVTDQTQGFCSSNPPGVAPVTSLVFGELCRLNNAFFVGDRILSTCRESLLPAIFSDILVPFPVLDSSNSSNLHGHKLPKTSSRQYHLLVPFIRNVMRIEGEDGNKEILAPISHHLQPLNDATTLLQFVDESLPHIVPAMVINNDYHALQMSVGFRLFLLGEKKRARRLQERKLKPRLSNERTSDSFLGISRSGTYYQGFAVAGGSQSAQQLEKATRDLCLLPQLVHHILAKLLIHPDRDPLTFFLRTVTRSKFTLQQILNSCELLVLKSLVWELGARRASQWNSSTNEGVSHHENVVKAIQKGALLKIQGDALADPTESVESKDDDFDVDTKEKVGKDAATDWISSNFMYLLANVVQRNWPSGSLDNKIHGITCLRFVLQFLRPVDSPQYFPQITATVNMVMTQTETQQNGQNMTEVQRGQLRLLAVQILSAFVRMVLSQQHESVGSNLSTIVASLFPIISNSRLNDTCQEVTQLGAEARKEAVSLLEELVDGDVGKKIAPYFNDVPFLATSPHLDNLRTVLRSHGVDLDNLHVLTQLSSRASQRGDSRDSLGRKSGASEANVSSPSSTGLDYSVRLQAALLRRLNTLRALLSHENVSVRRVVIQHISQLVESNRGLFHKIVEMEEGSSMARFLTILKQTPTCNTVGAKMRCGAGPQKAIAGATGVLVKTLLTRCALETDPEAIEDLSICLGEIGAIDPNRLDLNQITAVDDVETAPKNEAWRLSQPPWKSQVARYSLQLVTKQLVVALKAAPTSVDQHKIAFTIQEQLILLDKCAINHSDISNSGKVNEKKSNDQATNSGGTTTEKEGLPAATKREMSPWLSGKLAEVGVLEIIEPFWYSNYKQGDTATARTPPFFRIAGSYYLWISSLSRFLVTKGREHAVSSWQEFFYACRSAIRSSAGIGVAEFILPLLVLDILVFGDTQDRKVVLQEIQDVLSCAACATTSDEQGTHQHSSRMNQTERHRAVNTVFMVIDTLRGWADRETEERATNTTTSARKTRRDSFSSSEVRSRWPGDESLNRIEDFLGDLPLSVCARAAAAVGMHARALRLAEMDARAAVVKQIFDGDYEQDRDSPSSNCLGVDFLDHIDASLVKQVLVQLDDTDALSAMAERHGSLGPSTDVLAGIREKENRGEWTSALQDYERALQLVRNRTCTETPSANEGNQESLLEQGMLHCLLKLGQYESILNQVSGIGRKQGSQSPIEETKQSELHARALPIAVEAAWKLGRWTALDDLIAETTDKTSTRHTLLDMEDNYAISLGNVFLGLETGSQDKISQAISNARATVMGSLANTARDSYARSYPHLLRLHCIREVEHAADFFLSTDEGQDNSINRLRQLSLSSHAQELSWEGRLAITSPSGSDAVIETRLALSMLARDPELEGELWLTMGKKARKGGLLHVAENSLAKSEAAYYQLLCTALNPSSRARIANQVMEVKVQLAKLKHEMGESGSALRILNLDNIQGINDSSNQSLQKSLSLLQRRRHLPVDRSTQANESMEIDDLELVGKGLLQSTQWMVEGALKGVSEVKERFQLVHRLRPNWERAHFYYAKYIDSLFESRMAVAVVALSGRHDRVGIDDETLRTKCLATSESCQNYLLIAMRGYGEALKLDQKHVYQALPRLLSLWFDFTSIDGAVWCNRTQQGNVASNGSPDNTEELTLSRNQDQANKIMAGLAKHIPLSSFYTAIPQLISRVVHHDEKTSQIVQSVLKKVLTTFPAQGMWSLAWLRFSSDRQRSKIGEDIFKGAQKNLQKQKEKRLHDLLVASKSLFKYFIELAKFQPKQQHCRSFNVKTWKGEVELSDFIPPVQAALTIPRSSLGKSNTREVFPAFVPRMRTIDSKIQVMNSKARPKKIIAHAIPAENRGRSASPDVVSSSGSTKQDHPDDIGQLHFLVKQEAKGDLRKDARVQDLNNVINRLLRADGSSTLTQQRRRLSLRTFAVTCLSEDCGILEWVPNTDALRSLVSKSYNPQAAPDSGRRRGPRITNFQDPILRNAFLNAQDTYVKQGNLIKAAAMFEENCLKPYPPLLYWWFVQEFPDPHAWYEARTKFTLSTAAWSAVGHVIGLGDRHSENILVEMTSGECVHVDFDCIFDKGLNLPRPEVVPFRLTPNMVDAFGPTGSEGTFSGGLQQAMGTLRDNRDTLLSVLEPFLKDPVIDWKRHRSQQKNSSGNTESRETQDAKRSIKIIEGRLKGIYNLRNPNFRKIRRTDGVSGEDEMSHLIPLSVEGQVRKMIAEASSHENLVQLYIGWMPWI